jgi:formamidopyrimidine-DNA glycosylase
VPELPEVETVRRAMETHLLGRSVTRAWTSGLPLREPVSRARVRSLVGETVTEARRRAKFLLLALSSGRSLLVHLGMTGNLVFRGGERHLHDHVVLGLDEGPPLVYEDPRRFGLFLVQSARELSRNRWLRDLGVEPLSAEFDAEYLRQACRGRRRPIKSLLLDGRIVVGVGNIYASEALFGARIRPTTPAGRIGRERAERLVEEIKSVLQRAIRRGGTTISDYLGSGDGGRFQQELAVYGRAGEDCVVCDRPLRNRTIAGRSTFYCTSCQH